MKLLETQFLSEFEGLGGPRLPAGSVLDVNADTAVRWLDRGIAVYAKRGATTRKDERKARLLARLEALEAEEDDAEDVAAFVAQPSATLTVQPTTAWAALVAQPSATLTVQPTTARRGRRPKVQPAPLETDDSSGED